MQAGNGQRQRGVSLIELMVALLISLFLLLGAVTVFNQSQSTYRASEGVARLQETARLAMDVVETDIRMANFWGMNNRADYIINRAGPGQSPPAEFTAQQQSNVSLCGAANGNWMINLNEYVGGSNNAYGLTCAGSNYQAGSDVVFIRRANEAAPVTLDANRVYLQTSRIQGTLFVPGCSGSHRARPVSRPRTCRPLPSPARSRRTPITFRRNRRSGPTCRRCGASAWRTSVRQLPPTRSSTKRSCPGSKTCRFALASTPMATPAPTSTSIRALFPPMPTWFP